MLDTELKNYLFKAVQEPMNLINQQKKREQELVRRLSTLSLKMEKPSIGISQEQAPIYQPATEY
jgi:hypothetical protein